MPLEVESSDIALLDLLRQSGPLSVAQLAAAMQVTATAVRQRLVRLLAQGDLQRTVERTGRGRPGHRYALTDKGRRRAGSNFADLAIALWQEIRDIKDAEVRRGLLARISKRLAASYAGQVAGSSVDQRMESLAEVFRQRQIPFEVDRSHELPTLRASACPYPDLAEQDRSVCSMERMLFSELVGENLRLTDCRLDGHSCCTFEAHKPEAQARELGSTEAQTREIGATSTVLARESSLALRASVENRAGPAFEEAENK